MGRVLDGKAIQALISETKQARLWADPASHALETIEIEHFEVHRGDSYSIAAFLTVGGGTFYDWEFSTPDKPELLHMFWDAEVQAESELYVYEDAALTGGANVRPVNRNRNSPNESDVQVFVNPMVSHPGALLWSWKLGSGKKFGGEQRERNEFILRRNVTYLFRVRNVSVSPEWISVQFHWYELANKD